MVSFLFFSLAAMSHNLEGPSAWEFQNEKASIIVDADVAKALDLPDSIHDPVLGLSVVQASAKQLQLISQYQHFNGKCGGFKFAPKQPEAVFSRITQRSRSNALYDSLKFGTLRILANKQVASALEKISSEEVKNFVEWFSAMPTRYARSPKANDAVLMLKEKVDLLMKDSSLQWNSELISHTSVDQKSLKVTITGNQRPDEIIVLGGHVDSIADWGFSRTAPGADDNASGSGSLYEALRVLKDQAQPQRTIEFFWYAGEELGLLGSDEIATQYRSHKKKVIAVLQLDMTGYPGLAKKSIGSAHDFTSAFLREYLIRINQTYGLGLKITPFKCGYACSDHASWYSEGFATLMPFESTDSTMNRSIHTTRDLAHLLDFEHAADFAKIALIFAMDLGNSSLKEAN